MLVKQELQFVKDELHNSPLSRKFKMEQDSLALWAELGKRFPFKQIASKSPMVDNYERSIMVFSKEDWDFKMYQLSLELNEADFKLVKDFLK